MRGGGGGGGVAGKLVLARTPSFTGRPSRDPRTRRLSYFSSIFFRIVTFFGESFQLWFPSLLALPAVLPFSVIPWFDKKKRTDLFVEVDDYITQILRSMRLTMLSKTKLFIPRYISRRCNWFIYDRCQERAAIIICQRHPSIFYCLTLVRMRRVRNANSTI